MEQLKALCTIIVALLFIGETLAATCIVRGDPHTNTLDGKKYNLMHAKDCEYNLVVNTDFGVIGNLVACRHHGITCVDQIRVVDSQGDDWLLKQGGDVTDGLDNPINLPFLTQSGGTITDLDKNIEVQLVNGVRVLWDKKRVVTIEVPESFKNTGLSGACGNFDGQAGNDPTDTTDPREFVTNWGFCYGYGYR